MNLIRSIWATTLFEIKRSFSVQRVLVAAILAGFPPAMVTVITIAGRRSGDQLPLDNLLIIILVSIVGLLSQLLWATPNVYTELEGKSWIFIASRPRGRISLFLGKYLSAVAFSFAVCFIAISLCLGIRTYALTTQVNPAKTWLAMNSAMLLACFSYSAIFSVIGTLFQKRAMVFGAAYIILSEAILANVPAIISRFTARFHLQAIAADWLGWFHPIPEEQFRMIFGDTSTAFHLTCLISAIIILLAIGCTIVTARQYITAEEA